jgi:hypothetical protein
MTTIQPLSADSIHSVFSTMSLEDQQVSLAKVEEIVLSLLEEKELKGGQFFTDQVC